MTCDLANLTKKRREMRGSRNWGQALDYQAMQDDWQRFTQEVKRVHARYLIEVVEAFGLCPWAKEARLKGRVNMHVTCVASPDPAALLAEVDACMREATTEIGMVICPLLQMSSAEFGHLVSDVRAAEEQRWPRGEQHLAFAGFHPNATPNLTTPERLVPYLRRSPDPMLQVVRIEVLARVRNSQEYGTSYVDPSKLALLSLDELPIASVPPLAARVAQANMRTVTRVGIDALERILDDIQADRNRTYAVQGVSPTHAHIGDGQSETNSVLSGNRDEKPEPKAG